MLEDLEAIQKSDEDMLKHIPKVEEKYNERLQLETQPRPRRDGLLRVQAMLERTKIELIRQVEVTRVELKSLREKPVKKSLCQLSDVDKMLEEMGKDQKKDKAEMEEIKKVENELQG